MGIKPVCLIIRDGWGRGRRDDGDAIHRADTPFADRVESRYPTTLLQCSGESVGLPKGYQGNSEVGHINIGAGRVVYQSLSRIDRSIRDGSFCKIPALLKALNTARSRKSRIHLVGLIQEEGIHAVTRHALAILRTCREKGLTDVLVHGISDGRDTPPKSALEHFDHLQKGMDEIGVGRVATVTGRFYAMDRDRRWPRTRLFYDALMKGKARETDSYREAIESAYRREETDEFIRPCKINYHGVGKKDVIIFFNFRYDRARQITRAIVEKDFDEFPVISHDILTVTMTHYYDDGHFLELFSPVELKQILGEVIARRQLKQLRCSETEKFAHVTYFLNALRNDPFPGEDRILVPSPDEVETYDLKPQMSAPRVLARLIAAIENQDHDLIICNFANCDMVGHTGKFSAIVRAVETVDQCSQEVTEKTLNKGGAVILTADHGNAEQTRLEDGSPMTAHTINPVPVSIIGAGGEPSLRKDGKLGDIAPTILALLGIPQPEEMTGRSLIMDP